MDSYLKSILWKNQPIDSFFLKQIKTLRTKIVHRVDSSEQKIIGVTSAVDGEGKTTISLNIASYISANGDRNVLLVDCDLIKTDMTDMLGFNGNSGLSDYLQKDGEGKDLLFQKSTLKNLFFVSAGDPVPNSSELLTKNLFGDLVDIIRGKYDIVILDLPPVVSTPDPASIKNLVDGYILVYHAGETPRDLLEYAIDEIGVDRVIGVVFNRVKKQAIQKYKSKYYYYYDKKEQDTPIK